MYMCVCVRGCPQPVPCPTHTKQLKKGGAPLRFRQMLNHTESTSRLPSWSFIMRAI